MKFTVIGSSNGGIAFTGWLINLGHDVTLYTRTEEKYQEFVKDPNIRLSGMVDTTLPLDSVTNDPLKGVEGAEIIMIVTPADTHRSLAAALAPVLVDGQLIVLNPGRTFGSHEFYNTLRQHGCVADVTVAETDTLLFTCRNEAFNHSKVYTVKQDIKLACLQQERTAEAVEVMQRVFPSITTADSILHTGLTNIGMVFHPSPILFNYTRIENGHKFLYYKEAITPAVAEYIECLDAERVNIAKALGVEVESAKEWIKRSYGVDGSNLYEAIQNNAAYDDVYTPQTVHCRYIWEDVPTGLVPFSCAGKLAGVDTTYIDTSIRLANALYKTDFYKSGRTIKSLEGLLNPSPQMV